MPDMDDELKKMADAAGLDDDEREKLAEMNEPEYAPDGEGQDESATEGAEDKAAAPEPVEKEEPVEAEKPKKKPSIREEMVEYRKKARELEEKLTAAEKKAQEQESQWSEREKRYTAMIDQIKADREKPAAPETPQIPDRDENPVDYFDHRINEMAEQVKKLAEAGQMDQAAAKHNEAVLHDITAYRQQNPEYDKAFAHLVQKLDRVYAASGVDDPAMRYRLCQEQIRNVTSHSLQSGASACARLWDMAQEFGYAPAKAELAPANGGGKVSTDDLERISRGQSEAAGMPGASDARGSGLTYAKIADMPYKELDKLVKQYGSLENVLQAASAN